MSHIMGGHNKKIAIIHLKPYSIENDLSSAQIAQRLLLVGCDL